MSLTIPTDPEGAGAALHGAAVRAHLKRLFDHLAWADRRVLDLLHAAPGARQQSVMRVFSHLLAAERVWLLRLRGEESRQQPIWPEFSLEEMSRLSTGMAASFAEYVAALSEEDLAAEVAYSNSQGITFRSTVLDVLTHVAMHGGYHRGQIAAAVRGAGEEPVNTDFITYAREGM